MSFQPHLLPDALSYFEALGLKITGPKNRPWFTTECRFHGGSDSMRVHQVSGAWKCMSCEVKGGGIIAHEMQLSGDSFTVVAKRLGAWVDDGKSRPTKKRSSPSPRDALKVLGFETELVAIAAGNLANGYMLTTEDHQRLKVAGQRILSIAEAYK